MSRKPDRTGGARRETTAPATTPARTPFLWDLGGQIILCALTVVSFSLIFDPWGVWPLAFMCLFPWSVAVTRASRAWLAHWMSYLAGSAFFLIKVRWMEPVTGLGYIALALYIAVYWPLASWAVRAGRRRRIPLALCLPVAWVATEWLRGVVMSGFPWFFLGHGLAGKLWFIQIADITGAYGVTFMAAMVNGFIADVYLTLVTLGKGEWPVRRLWLPGGLTVAGVAATVAYGSFQLDRANLEPGPRVAVIQEDFPLISQPPYGAPSPVVFARYLSMGARAARESPDLIVFPETPWSGVQNLEFVSVENNVVEGIPTRTWSYGARYHRATEAFARGDYATVNRILREFARTYREYEFPQLPQEGGPAVPVVVGSMAIETFPQQVYPRVQKYNSALMYDSAGAQKPQRYDKIHLVPFGEAVPFRFGRLHWLYLWLNGLSPFSGEGGTYEYSLTPGDEHTVFDLDKGDRSWRFGTPICYEDVMPYVVRDYVWEGGRRRVDFLINISNDGWFLHSAELPQHLAISTFRAVENRVGIARAVNTGVSGFIDPNGRVYSVVTDEKGRSYGEGVVGYRVDNVLIDKRGSFYGRFGDWFAWTCLGLTAVLWLDAFIVRHRRRRMARAQRAD